MSENCLNIAAIYERFMYIKRNFKKIANKACKICNNIVKYIR